MRFLPNFKSITVRLILLGMAILLAGALARVFILADYLRKDISELASTQLLTLSNYVAKNIDHDIVRRRALLERVAERFPLDLLHDAKQSRRWLAERYEMNPLFSLGMFVLDPDGIALTDYPLLARRAGRSYADRDYFQQAMRGESAIGRPVIGRAVNKPVLPMAVPIRDRRGKVRAVLVGISALNSPDFLEALYNTQVGSTGGLVLASPRDQLFIGASDADIALRPMPKEGAHPQHDQAVKGFRGVGVGIRFGVEEMAAIASVPSSGWFVVARLPTSEIFAPVIRLRNFIMASTAIILPIFLVIMVFGMRRVLRPLMNAAQHADRMTRGERPFEHIPVLRDDEVGHLTAAFNRVLSKLLESGAKLEHIAHHDALTGLPNRQLLADRMKTALARAQRSQGQVAVLFLDLDGFKPVNDEFGHEGGDTALREVAERLSGTIRREDTVARVGGDEFVVLLSDLNEKARESVDLVANKCLAVFQQAFVIDGQPRRLGTSIGIAIGDGECPPDKLLIAADQAMYRAKQLGGGHFLWASETAG